MELERGSLILITDKDGHLDVVKSLLYESSQTGIIISIEALLSLFLPFFYEDRADSLVRCFNFGGNIEFLYVYDIDESFLKAKPSTFLEMTFLFHRVLNIGETSIYLVFDNAQLLLSDQTKRFISLCEAENIPVYYR